MQISVITIYSIMSSVIIFSIGTIIVYFLHRNMFFAVKGKTTLLLIMVLFLAARLAFPFDNKNAIVIQSKFILPSLQRFFEIEIMQSVTIVMIFFIVWVVGSLVVLMNAIIDSLKGIQQIKNYETYTLPQMEIITRQFSKEKIKVEFSTAITVPQVIGLFRPHIFLPQSGDFTNEELKMIIMHELWHVKGKDIVIKFFYLLLEVFFWWNPIIHIFRKELNILLEFRCDMNVTKRMSQKERTIYLDAIIKSIKNYNVLKTKTSEYALTLFDVKDTKVIEQRFHMILNDKAYSKSKVRVKTLIFSLGIFICSYFVILQPAFSPPVEKGHIEITVDNAYLVREGQTIKLYLYEQYAGEISLEDIKQVPYSKLIIIEKGESE